MTKTEEDQMFEDAKPLMKWMNENTHPHCKVVVTTNSVELLEGLAYLRTTEFVKD